MARLPTYEEMGKKVAEEVLDGYIYKGKTLREWIDILAQTRWIPVSKRLPKKDETEVLITLKEDGSVLQATYLDDRTFDTEAYGWFAIKDISAWMLLPKPYEESEDENEQQT